MEDNSVVLDRSHSSALNIAVLQQRMDPQIECILGSAPHAVLYLLDQTIKTWVCSRSGSALRVLARIARSWESVLYEFALARCRGPCCRLKRTSRGHCLLLRGTTAAEGVDSDTLLASSEKWMLIPTALALLLSLLGGLRRCINWW